MELPKAIENGPNINRYVSTSVGLSPEIRLAQHYNDLTKRWVYYPDPPSYDGFTEIEEAFQKNRLKGDCEDFSAALIAVCKRIDLQCHVALGAYLGKGHAWAEVLIDTKLPKSKTLSKIKSAFGNNVSYVSRSDGVWLQMSPEGSLSKYNTSHLIRDDGKLISVDKKL